jgi:hypothetical protein
LEQKNKACVAVMMYLYHTNFSEKSTFLASAGVRLPFNGSGPEDTVDENGLVVVSPRLGTNVLQSTWTVWFLHRGPGVKISNYLQATKQLGSFSTAEEFWDLYCHLRRVDKLSFTSEYQLFRKGIKPMWEDPVNAAGGKWVVRFKRPLKERRRDELGMDASSIVAANRTIAHKHAQCRHQAAVYWESLVLAIVGGSLGEPELAEEVVGAVVSVRRDEDILSVWNRHGDDQDVIEKIKRAMQDTLGLGPDVLLEYKIHQESIKEGAEKQANYEATHAAHQQHHHAKVHSGVSHEDMT